MSDFNRLAAVAVVFALIGGLIAPAPLEARTKKGDQYFVEGARDEAKKDYDAALAAYEKALAEDPAEVSYRIAVDKTRPQASFDHLEKGFKLRNQGQLTEALAEFQKAFGINPANTAASQEILRTQEMIDRERRRVEQTGKEAPPEVRAETPSEEAKSEVRDKIDRMLPLPELKPLNPEKITLKINNQPPKVLFDTVAKVAGLNVIWDPDYQQGRNVSLDLNNSTAEEALDDAALLTKSFWKALPGGNTIFVTNDNRNKRNDYEDQVLKVFYLSNVSTPQELQEIVNAVRAVTELTRLMPYNTLHAIIARGEADRVALAEKIIHDLDKPRAEVVIDVIVMQTSSDVSKQITAAIANGTGLNVPAIFNPRSTIQSTISNNSSSTTNSSTTNNSTTTNSSSTSNTNASVGSTSSPYVPLSNLGHLSTADFAITLPGALLQAALSNANTKILQTPEVRSVDNSKASIKIGEREPTATGSFQPGIGGVGINPLVNTQFTYIDVGVNLDVQPQVHENDEVSMHVELDISSVAGYVNLGGINQPIIQQNKVVHDLRVREGEVSLLAGLSQSQDTNTVTGIPGLSSIPIIGHLFSGKSVDHTKSDLMIALIPHIVRRPDVEPENLKGIAVGNATTVKLNYAPRTTEIIQPQGNQPQANQPKAPAGQTPGPTAPPAPGAPAGAAPAPQVPPPPPPGGARVFFQPAPVDAAMGSNVTISLAAAGIAGAMSAPLQIRYDPKVLRLNDITVGDLMAQGNQPPVFTKNIQNDAGTATVQITRPPGAAAVSGGGT
ncbi:MAG TPA: cohesin domain-containing protein, partial [Bryobacteraceae bacterium]|nr:cohesin domain-containing protein [Bryobacteraceae bacterium]